MQPYFPPLTAIEAALLAGVRADTIRQWRHRGLLTPVRGSTPRRPLYDGRAVLAVSRRNTPAVNAA